MRSRRRRSASGISTLPQTPSAARRNFSASWASSLLTSRYRSRQREGSDIPTIDYEVIDGFHLAIREGRDDYEAEYRIIRPSDGQARWIFGRGRVIRDRDGSVLRYAGVDIDITDRKRAEDAALRLVSIVELSNDAILSKDLDGVITSWNDGATRLFGYAPEEIIGKPVTVLIPEDRHDEEPGIIDRIRRGQRIDHYETVRRRKDGTLVEISLTVSPIKDTGGRVVGASNISRDIAERRRAEAQERLLLAEMNHRIKNLFALASGVVAISAHSATTAPELAEMIRDRLGALSRAHALTLPEITGTGAKIERSATLAALYARCCCHTPQMRVRASPIWQFPARKFSSERKPQATSLFSCTSLRRTLRNTARSVQQPGTFASNGRSGDGQLNLTWRERGGPALLHEPDFQGFGGRLTDRIVADAFGGQIFRHWARDGLTIRLSLPTLSLAK